MWIFPRSTSCPSPPVEAALTSESRPLSLEAADVLSTSLMWRSKPTPARSWLRAWKRVPWLRHLSGRTFDPSTAAPSLASWISSLEATRASRSPLRASASAPPIPGTSGLPLPVSSESAGPAPSSSRTSPVICAWDSARLPTSFEEWATALRRASTQRRKSARLTSGNGSSSSAWPTPRAQDSYERSNRKTIEAAAVGEAQMTLTRYVKGVWATPTARGGKDGACAKADVPTNGLLGRQAARWQTPSVTDAVGRDYTYPAGDHSKPFPTISGQAQGTKYHGSAWNGRPAPTTPMDGETTSPDTPISRLQALALNPSFVEALMGWQIESTVCAFSETASSQTRPNSPSAISPDLWASTDTEKRRVLIEFF